MSGLGDWDWTRGRMRGAGRGDRWMAERMEVGADALFRPGTCTRRRRGGAAEQETGTRARCRTQYTAAITLVRVWEEIERARRRTGTVGGDDGGVQGTGSCCGWSSVETSNQFF